MASTYTSLLNLAKPGLGDLNYHTPHNNNFDLLDIAYGSQLAAAAAAEAAAAAAAAASDDLAEVYLLTGTFNGTAGVTVALPKSVDAVNEYTVSITPTTRAAAIGDIEVEKSTADFVVKSHDNNTADTFMATVTYVVNISKYGVSIFRRWYVSPDTGITDHSDDTDAGSLAWVIDQIGVNPAVIELPGNRTYALTLDLDATVNTTELYFVFQPGAVIQPAATKSFTVRGPQHILAALNQQVFDITNNSIDPVVFEIAGVTSVDWFKNNTTPGTTGMSDAGQCCIAAIADGSAIELQPSTYKMNLELKGRFLLYAQGSKYDTIIVPETVGQHILYDLDSDVRGVEMRNFSIDGTNQTGSYDGIHLETQNNLNIIQNLHITDAARYGIYIDGQRALTPDVLPGTAINGGRWNTIENTDIFLCGTAGIYIYDATAPSCRNVKSSLHGGGSYTGYGFQFVHCIEVHCEFLESWYCRYGVHIKGGAISQIEHVKVDHWGQNMVLIEANETDGQIVQEIAISNLMGSSDRIEADDTYPAISVKSTASYGVEGVVIDKISVTSGFGQNVPSLAISEDNAAGGGISYNRYDFYKIWFGANVVEEDEISLAATNLSYASFFARSGGKAYTDQYIPIEVIAAGSGYTLMPYGFTELTTAAGTITGTQPDGTAKGERKTITKTAGTTTTATITVTTHRDGDGGSYLFNADEETVCLEWLGSTIGWAETSNFGSVTYTP